VSRGSLEHLGVDNGLGLMANAVREWIEEQECRTIYIEPRSPWENPYIESSDCPPAGGILEPEGARQWATCTGGRGGMQSRYRAHNVFGSGTPLELAPQVHRTTTTLVGRGIHRQLPHSGRFTERGHIALLPLVTLLIGVNGLGFITRPEQLQIRTPIGDFSWINILIVCSVGLSLLVALHRGLPARRNSLFMAVAALYSLIALRVFVDYVTILWFSTYEIEALLRNVLTLFPYLYFLPIVFLIKNERSAHYFLSGVLVLGFLVAVLVVVQYVTGSSITATRFVTYEYGRIRMIQPGIQLAGWAGFITIAMAIGAAKRRSKALLGLGACVLLAAFGLQLHRSALVALGIGTVFTIVSKVVRRRFSLKGIVLFAVLLSMVLGGAIVAVRPLRLALGIEVSSMMSDVSNPSGSLAFRFLLLQNAWRSSIAENSVLMGRGFHWMPFEDFETYLKTGVVSGPQRDNAIANIVYVFGLVGLVVYVFVFFTVFRCGARSLRVGLDEHWDAVVTGTLAFNVTTLVLLFFSDPIMGTPDTYVLVASWALLSVVLDLRGKGELEGGKLACQNCRNSQL